MLSTKIAFTVLLFCLATHIIFAASVGVTGDSEERIENVEEYVCIVLLEIESLLKIIILLIF